MSYRTALPLTPLKYGPHRPNAHALAALWCFIRSATRCNAVQPVATPCNRRCIGAGPHRRLLKLVKDLSRKRGGEFGFAWLNGPLWHQVGQARQGKV